MCGIAGSFGISDPDLLSSMLSCIIHRGPDEEGTYLDDDVMLGARRLSIIDIEGGSQPITNEDGSVVVVFNGEIYNYDSIRQSLRDRGHRFETDVDTEVLVHLWEEYGTDMPRHLDGMFVFAIFDRNAESVLLARDRLGIKPLYYTEVDEGIVWGSEIQSLLKAGVDRTLDEQAVYEFFSLQYTPCPRTPFNAIRKLPPGHTALVSDSGVSVDQYWTLEHNPVDGSIEEIAKQVRSHLERSVESRLMADVPIGAYLSGGLDSSAIVGLMSQHVDDLKTYSVGFKSAALDESGDAKFVADHFGTDHTNIQVDLSSLDLFGDLVAQHGEPLADPAALPSLALSRRASEECKVVLTGEGADELFGGYHYYDTLATHRDRYGRLPEVVYDTAGVLADHAPAGNRYFAHFESLQDDAAAYLQWRGREDERPESYLTAATGFRRLHDVVAEAMTPGNDSVSKLTAYDIQHWLPDDLLFKLDQTTMAASLEGRVPFLDHRLVEYAYGIPSRYKRGVTSKPVLRRAMADILPERTHQRDKQGFVLPVAEWFRASPPAIEHWLTESKLEQTPYIDSEVILEYWRDHRRGETNHARVLWRTLSFVSWYHTIALEE